MTLTHSHRIIVRSLVLASVIVGCEVKQQADPAPGTYAYDKAFLLEEKIPFVELQDGEGARLLASADYQGRVLTSSANGEAGNSYGWLNYSLLSSGVKNPQFNPIGGEERFWLGPEGGQFSFYFHKPDSFTFAHWKVPALIDTEPFEVSSQNDQEIVFSRKAQLSNYSATLFDLGIVRKIALLKKGELEESLKVIIPEELKWVAYQTNNEVKNTGTQAWTKETGLPSIWLLGMFTPSDQTTVIIPFHPQPGSKEAISTNYFGDIPSERLTIQDSVLFFSCDGKYRSKLGLPPTIAKPLAASYDFAKNILTLIQFEVSADRPYVNSKWEHQTNPFSGDAVNSYNDGPLADGSQMGPFYELESSSHGLELQPGEAKTYRQITAHFEGNFASMIPFVKSLLGVDLNQLNKK